MKLTKEIEQINEGVIKAAILRNGSGWETTEKKNYSVIESGPDSILENKIVEIIRSANEMICLQSFLIQDNNIIQEMVNAVEQRNVRVFILSASNVRLQDNMEEEPDFKRDNYVQMLNQKFKYNFVLRSGENFHAKYIITDPHSNPRGFICTNNFTFNGFKKNVETGVPLSAEQCEELFKVFVYNFWECAQDEFSEKGFEKIKPLGKYDLIKLQHILITSPSQATSNLKSALEKSIAGVKKSIWLSTFGIDLQQSTVQDILAKAKMGIDVMLFTRESEKLMKESLNSFVSNGVQVYIQPLLHAKMLITDESEGFQFTANFQKHGLDDGCEVGLILNNQQLRDAILIMNVWKRTFPFRLHREVKISDTDTHFVYAENGRLVEKKITSEQKTESRNVQKLSELKRFFNEARGLVSPKIKIRKLTLVAEIPQLKEDQKKLCRNNSPFEILQIGKNQKICVIHQNFQIEMLEELVNQDDMNIYSY